MKRMSGGLVGKETRSVFVSVAAAVAAKMTNRPVKLTLNRDTDMSITGGRHAFLSKYKAGAVIDNDGTVKLYALDVHIYNNGGFIYVYINGLFPGGGTHEYIFTKNIDFR